MKIFTDLIEINNIDKIPKAMIALGAFDSIHLGHIKIISRVVELAKCYSGTSVVFTFSNHPLSVIDSSRCPPRITSEQDKEALIKSLGVDVFSNIPFTEELLKMSPNSFINLLRQKFQLKKVVVGNNFRYGHRGVGTTETLQKAGQDNGFSVEIADLVKTNVRLNNCESSQNIIVSSTAIRELVKEGNVGAAARLLGRFFSLSGRVVDGDKRGRSLGFPTANIAVDSGLLFPADGVYAIKILIDRKIYDGVANIGNNPTFACRQRRLEAHVLNFSGHLYGKNIIVNFVEHIRGEVAFATPEQLKFQIANDIKAAQDKLGCV